MSKKIYGAVVTTPHNPEKIAKKAGIVTPKMYGAVGDGATNDTAAFQRALSENREVYVPEGNYVLSEELTIRGNCKLSLSQGAVLNFTQTEGNCISLGKLSHLEGNHATINVPYFFNGNVLYATSLEDGGSRTPEPFTQHWTPMWKAGRYVTDINIAKIDSSGLHYSDDGVCYGTALYIHIETDGRPETTTYMWGNKFTGLRISGGFSYGVRMVTVPGENVWCNNTEIEGYVEQCEVGCCIERTHTAVVSLIIQPRVAKDGTKYAKHGVKLVNSSNADLRNTRVWDWEAANTLKTGTAEECEYQAYALYGVCKGTLINTHSDHTSCWEESIYSENIFNLMSTTLVSARGVVQVHPKYAFYKNFSMLNYAYTSGRVSWRDGVNISRYDIPVVPLNPYANPDRVYKIGSFKFNDSDDYPNDPLTEQTLTIEENNRYGLSGWSNLYFTSSNSASHVWKPVGRADRSRVPVYYYSVDGDTYTVYKLIRDVYDMQQLRNCKVSITNSRRFILEWEDMGSAEDIDTTRIVRIDSVYNAASNNNPKLQGMYGYASGNPVICTDSAVLDERGLEVQGSTVKELALKEYVDAVSEKDRKYSNRAFDGYFETKGFIQPYTNRIGDYLADTILWDSDGVTQEENINNIVSGLFSVTAGQTVRFKGVRNINWTGQFRLYMYNKTDGTFRALINLNVSTGDQNVGHLAYDEDTNTFIWSNISEIWANLCNFRLSGCLVEGYTMEDVVLTIDERIVNAADAELLETVKIKKASLPDLEENYELIESITADGSIIDRTHEPDGTPYSFKSVLVNLITPAGVLLSGFNMRTMVGDNTIQAWFDPISSAVNGEWNTAMWCERKGGLWWWYSKTKNDSSTTNTIKGNFGHFAERAVTRVCTSAAVTAGNIVEIWAIRA